MLRVFGVCLLLSLSLSFAACTAKTSDTNADPVTRGGYLVRSAGCADCHTPMKLGERGPEPDESRLLSGHPADLEAKVPSAMPEGFLWAGTGSNTAFAGPWGVSFASNLTSDRETGLGSWTEEQFVAAIRTGQHKGQGRAILPPMPWTAIRNFTDQDLRAMFAYLRSVPAIHNAVPEPLPPATNGSH